MRKVVCNVCNKGYGMEKLNKYDTNNIINVKTGLSLFTTEYNSGKLPGMYRIMYLTTLPCQHRDSHWMFIE